MCVSRSQKEKGVRTEKEGGVREQKQGPGEKLELGRGPMRSSQSFTLGVSTHRGSLCHSHESEALGVLGTTVLMSIIHIHEGLQLPTAAPVCPPHLHAH